MRHVCPMVLLLFSSLALSAQTPEEVSTARKIDAVLTECLLNNRAIQAEERQFWISSMPTIRDQGNLGELRAICFRDRATFDGAEKVRKIVEEYGDADRKGNRCDFFWVNIDPGPGEIEFLIDNRCDDKEAIHYRILLSELDPSSIKAYQDPKEKFWYVTFHTKNLQRTIWASSGAESYKTGNFKTSTVPHFGRFLARDAAIAKELAQVLRSMAETH